MSRIFLFCQKTTQKNCVGNSPKGWKIQLFRTWREFLHFYEILKTSFLYYVSLRQEMSTPQFHKDPLSSTHRFHTRTKPFQHPKSLDSTPKSLDSILETPQFHNKTHQFHTPFSSTHASVPHRLYTDIFVWGVCWTKEFLVWNWGVFGVELSGFWCGTEGFYVELRGFLCWTEGFLVWNWGVCWNKGFLVWDWEIPIWWIYNYLYHIGILSWKLRSIFEARLVTDN